MREHGDFYRRKALEMLRMVHLLEPRHGFGAEESRTAEAGVVGVDAREVALAAGLVLCFRDVSDIQDCVWAGLGRTLTHPRVRQLWQAYADSPRHPVSQRTAGEQDWQSSLTCVTDIAVPMTEHVIGHRDSVPSVSEVSSQRQFLLDQSVCVETICEYIALFQSSEKQTDDPMSCPTGCWMSQTAPRLFKYAATDRFLRPDLFGTSQSVARRYA